MHFIYLTTLMQSDVCTYSSPLAQQQYQWYRHAEIQALDLLTTMLNVFLFNSNELN